jgi:hypothetical protein
MSTSFELNHWNYPNFDRKKITNYNAFFICIHKCYANNNQYFLLEACRDFKEIKAPR